VSRLFEYHRRERNGDVVALVDLDKICSVRVESEGGHHFPHLLIRFVDGYEVRDLVPPEAAERFVDAFRTYLQGRSEKKATGPSS
jgi:hypothetical protein